MDDEKEEESSLISNDKGEKVEKIKRLKKPPKNPAAVANKITRKKIVRENRICLLL